MTLVAEAAPVTAAVIDALRGEGIRTGDADIPQGGHGANVPASFYPYAVVYVGTSLMRGSLLDPKEDGLHRVQVSCVGRTREGAEVLRDRAANLLLQVDVLTIDGGAVVYTEHVASPPTFRDDDKQPSLYEATVVVNMLVTPAPAGS